MKDTMISLRLPQVLIDEYRKFCAENTFNVSKRLRKLMENDLEAYKKYKIERKKGEAGNSQL
jgi:hypothetical protein